MVPKYTIWLCCLLAASTAVRAQPGGSDRDVADFFSRKAWKDAHYEHQVRLQGEREEQDFWQDQRSYERQLYTSSPDSFRVYIQNKRDAYSAHQAVCRETCGHGDYYLRQASFYMQLGSGPDGNTWLFGTTKSGGGLIAARPQH